MSSKKLVSGLIYLLVIPLVCFGGIMFSENASILSSPQHLPFLPWQAIFSTLRKTLRQHTTCDNSRHDRIIRFRQDSFQLSAGL